MDRAGKYFRDSSISNQYGMLEYLHNIAKGSYWAFSPVTPNVEFDNLTRSAFPLDDLAPCFDKIAPRKPSKPHSEMLISTSTSTSTFVFAACTF